MRAEMKESRQGAADKEQQTRAAEQPWQTAAVRFCSAVCSLWRLLSTDEKAAPTKWWGGLFVNRGDRTPVELFVEGVRVWELGLRWLLAGKP